MPSSQTCPLDLSGLAIDQAHDGLARHALTRARLPNDGQRLVAVEIETNPTNSVDDPVLRGERDS